MHRLALLGTVAAAALALALPSHAAPPFTETFADSGIDVMSCDGFEVVMERNFDVRATDSSTTRATLSGSRSSPT